MDVLAWPACASGGNAYNRLLYDHVREGGGVDVTEFVPARALRRSFHVWHVHWPEAVPHRGNLLTVLGKLAAFVLLVGWARRRGTRLVWTVHNVRGHVGRHPRLETAWMWWFTRRLDGVIALSHEGRRHALLRWPALAHVPAAVIPHGHYLGAYPNATTRTEARRRLRLPQDASVVAFVGNVARYKSPSELVAAFRDVADREARLVIAGREVDGEGRRVREAAAGDPRIHLALGHVADGDLQLFLNAADLIACPYDEILNSGTVMLALSFGRRVLVPSRGAVTELRDAIGGGWVRTYEGELTPEILAAELCAARRADPDPADAAARLRRYAEWSAIGARTRQFYAGLLVAGQADG
jgi:beta-1,4-mannosyltransferase